MDRRFAGVKDMIMQFTDGKHLGNFTLHFFFFKDFIYLFNRDRDSQREREHKQGEWEKQAHSRGA